MRTRHLLSILTFPFNVLVTVPSLIYFFSGGDSLYEKAAPETVFMLRGVAIVLAAIGMTLLVKTILLFHNKGKGTLAPWDPPTKFVATGVYLHNRNPMISGGLMVLMGEVLFTGSFYFLIWWIVFAIAKHLYFVFHEEPELEKRFAEDYKLYKQHVPRWIPRWKAWDGKE